MEVRGSSGGVKAAIQPSAKKPRSSSFSDMKNQRFYYLVKFSGWKEARPNGGEGLIWGVKAVIHPSAKKSRSSSFSDVKNQKNFDQVKLSGLAAPEL